MEVLDVDEYYRKRHGREYVGMRHHEGAVDVPIRCSANTPPGHFRPGPCDLHFRNAHV